MKNINVLKTDKPSRLLKDLVDGTYQLKKEVLYGNRVELPLSIYITSDEEIKVGDWCIDEDGLMKCTAHAGAMNHYFQKIILTTDADLIKDGVQSIDDEFLEWFVNNPSCEHVNFKKIEGKYIEYGINVDSPILYKKIIQKEKNKDRTCTHNCSVVCGECQILK